jgi:hypothetical protein
VNVEHDLTRIAETGAAALLFAATFAWGGRVDPGRALRLERRSIISFAAGMSAAYVFVRLMPELHGARSAFVESVAVTLRYEGMAVYFVALLGFLAFYGLEHLRSRVRERTESEEDGAAFKLHVGGFAAYAGLMSYLLVHNLEENGASTAFYAIAIAAHFLAIDHSLQEEHGAAYQRIGRWVLAGMCVLGWAAGLLFALPHHVLALLLAFLSGAVIMNSAIMELPTEKDGRFVAFMVGGVAYGVALVPLA